MKKLRSETTDLVERILFAEDIPVQETVQGGMLSKKGLTLGDGRFNPKLEHGLHYFHNRILDSLKRSSVVNKEMVFL